MKTNHLLILIVAAIITAVQMNAMDNMTIMNAQNYLLKDIKLSFFSHKPTYQTIINHASRLNLPDDVIDKIIAYCSPESRKNLKKACKQLSSLASMNRLDRFIIHDFNIGNAQEKLLVFKMLIRENNTQLIKHILIHAQKEAEACNTITTDSTSITIDSIEITQKQYVQKRYLNPLLREALQQNNETMIILFEEAGADSSISNRHVQSRSRRFAPLTTACIIITFMGSIAGLTTALICASPEGCHIFNNTNL